MYWFIAALAVVVLGLAFLAYQGRLGGMPPVVDDRPGPDLPKTELAAQDVREVRFAVVMRGYSMSQVDAVMDRLADQMDGLPAIPEDDYAAWAGQDELASGEGWADQGRAQDDSDEAGRGHADVPRHGAVAVAPPASDAPTGWGGEPLGWPESVPVRA